MASGLQCTHRSMQLQPAYDLTMHSRPVGNGPARTAAVRMRQPTARRPDLRLWARLATPWPERSELTLPEPSRRRRPSSPELWGLMAACLVWTSKTRRRVRSPPHKVAGSHAHRAPVPQVRLRAPDPLHAPPPQMAQLRPGHPAPQLGWNPEQHAACALLALYSLTVA